VPEGSPLKQRLRAQPIKNLKAALKQSGARQSGEKEELVGRIANLREVFEVLRDYTSWADITADLKSGTLDAVRRLRNSIIQVPPLTTGAPH
jgi:hypothetical protein